MKACKKCGLLKPESAFYEKRTDKGVWLHGACKECCSAERKQWWKENRESQLAAHKKRLAEDERFRSEWLEKRRELSCKQREANPAGHQLRLAENRRRRKEKAAKGLIPSRVGVSKMRTEAHKEYDRVKSRLLRQKRRLETFARYGGVCACCGEDRTEFLAIDHIDGGGNRHRKAVKKAGGCNFYAYLRSQGYPPGYRVLCHNCNASMGYYGYCPHQGQNLADSAKTWEEQAAAYQNRLCKRKTRYRPRCKRSAADGG